jgi:hypothetical protein
MPMTTFWVSGLCFPFSVKYGLYSDDFTDLVEEYVQVATLPMLLFGEPSCLYCPPSTLRKPKMKLARKSKSKLNLQAIWSGIKRPVPHGIEFTHASSLQPSQTIQMRHRSS